MPEAATAAVVANVEQISYMFYDTQTINANTKDYFQTAEGTATNTDLDTNMFSNGLLPTGNKFYVRGISVALDADESVTDAEGFLKNSVLTLTVNNKTYFKAMCFNLPAGGGLTGYYLMTTAADSAILNNGNPQTSAIYKIKELVIDSSTPFKASIRSSYAVDTRARVILHGILERPRW